MLNYLAFSILCLAFFSSLTALCQRFHVNTNFCVENWRLSRPQFFLQLDPERAETEIKIALIFRLFPNIPQNTWVWNSMGAFLSTDFTAFEVQGTLTLTSPSFISLHILSAFVRHFFPLKTQQSFLINHLAPVLLLNDVACLPVVKK